MDRNFFNKKSTKNGKNSKIPLQATTNQPLNSDVGARTTTTNTNRSFRSLKSQVYHNASNSLNIEESTTATEFKVDNGRAIQNVRATTSTENKNCFTSDTTTTTTTTKTIIQQTTSSTVKKQLRSPKSKQRKLFRSPEVSTCDSSTIAHPIPVSLSTTGIVSVTADESEEDLKQKALSKSTQNIAMGSDISSTTIKEATTTTTSSTAATSSSLLSSIERTRQATEEYLTSKSNTTATTKSSSIFDHFFDNNKVIISTIPSSSFFTTTTTAAAAATVTAASKSAAVSTANTKCLSSDQTIPLTSDSVNRITPVASSSNIFFNLDNTLNNKSDNASGFFEATGNNTTSSSDLGSGNFNSITGTISSGSYYSDDYEFSILSNLNIDSEISDITTQSHNSVNINAPSQLSLVNKQQQQQQHQLSPLTQQEEDDELLQQPLNNSDLLAVTQSNESQRPSTVTSIITTIITNKQSGMGSGNSNDNSPPMRLAEYDDTIGSDLSTSASTKLTSTNTSFSGDSYTGGSMEAPTSPVHRLQNFVFKSNDSTKSFDVQTSPQLPVPPPVPRRSFQMQLEKQRQYAANIDNSGSPTMQQRSKTPSLSRSQTPDKNLTARINVCQLTSPNNPFLPEIIANRYATDDEQDDNILSPIMLKSSDLSVEEQSVVDHSKLSGCSVSPDIALSPLSTGDKYTSEFYGLTDSCRVIENESTSSRSYSLRSNINNNTTSTSSRYGKLFSTKGNVDKKNRLNLNQQQQQQQQQNDNNNIKTSSTMTTITTTMASKVSKMSPQSSFKRNLNPFSKHYNGSPPSSKEMNAKREEFLKATMKICLVVSPPSTKLHVKSKSLTHLDVLSYPINSSSNQSNLPDQPVSEHLDALSPQSQNDIPLYETTVPHSKSKEFQSNKVQVVNSPNTTSVPFYQHHPSSSASTGTTNSTACNKICCLGKTTIGSSSAETSLTNDQYETKYGSSNHQKTVSGSALAAASLNAASLPQFSGPICNTSNAPHLIQITTHQSPAITTGHLRSGSSIKKKSTFMLNRKSGQSKSEVSSSEYFSVHFCVENGGIEEELIQIRKGVTLLEALDGSLKRRNLNLSQINIADSNIHSLAETGSPPYGTLIDENTDTENLLGKIIIITEKNDAYLKSSRLGSLQKAASFGSRPKPPRLLSSASTEETTSEPDPKVVPAKQLKQRWSGLFGVKNPQQNQLCELLSKFSKQGGPPTKTTIKLEYQSFEIDALNYLNNNHKCWREFIASEELPDNEIKIQSAIWELVTTEIDYIHTLKTVTDLFLACLEALQDENILTDVDQNKLFSNIREICEANLKFWTLFLYPMVAHSIVNHTPMGIEFFEQGFVTFGSTFAPYKVYCAEQSTCQFYCKELYRTNTVFTSYLAWCESQKNCNRLRLADILVRPMQRLTKYTLLLGAIRKHINIENDAEMIDSMIRSVENFVCSVNTHLSTRQENERLKGIMARIESYDVVEANNEQLEKFIKQYSLMFDLCAPMKGCSNQHCRHLFLEGDLKLKDNISKSDVHCFLLTDILLICKTISKKSQGALKVIRQPYFTDRLMIKHKDNALYCVYLNEFQVAIAAFTLQCSEAKNWHDGITKAKHIYTRLKQSIQFDNSVKSYGQNSSGDNVNMLGVKKSPLNSSRGSRVSSLNNSHSGSVELNDSRNISIDFEKANSLSSDEGTNLNPNLIQKPKTAIAISPQKQKIITSNTLSVQPLHNLGQSLPNLTTSQSQVSNNTLLVPGYGRGLPSNNLLSPSHRGISYPPPSPTRGTLRRGFAFSSTIKNPPLLKTRNITSQNSVNFFQALSSPKPGNLSSQQQQQSHDGLIGSPHILSSVSSELLSTASNPAQTISSGNSTGNLHSVATGLSSSSVESIAVQNVITGSSGNSVAPGESDV